jgi:hypothetical protein
VQPKLGYQQSRRQTALHAEVDASFHTRCMFIPRDKQRAMSGLEELGGGHARASDRDRHRVSEELRMHCAEGRLDVDELERRLEQAMSASTIHQLAELVQDLPALAVPEPIREEPAKTPIGPPGIRPFTRRIEVPAPIDRVWRTLLDTIAVGLNRAGYELIYQDPTTLTFQRSIKERLTIDLEERGKGNTTMVIYGRASRRVRKHILRLHFFPSSDRRTR